ncbi:tetratricopeptide repeat protein [Actinokineospora sp. NPDC004072]
MAQPIDAVLADAARLTAAGRPRAAIEALRPVLAEHPDHAGAWCGLAAAFLDVGEPQRCLDAAKRAITLGEPAWAHRLASLALTELGRHEEAAISARESARRDPDDWRGQVALAEALAPTAPADALAAAHRAVAIAPEEPRTHEVLGNTAERAGDIDGAKAAYQESLRLDPTNPDAQAALTRLSRSAGRFGDVPWERSTAWHETDPADPDWTLVAADPARTTATHRPTPTRTVRFAHRSTPPADEPRRTRPLPTFPTDDEPDPFPEDQPWEAASADQPDPEPFPEDPTPEPPRRTTAAHQPGLSPDDRTDAADRKPDLFPEEQAATRTGTTSRKPDLFPEEPGSGWTWRKVFGKADDPVGAAGRKAGLFPEDSAGGRAAATGRKPDLFPGRGKGFGKAGRTPGAADREPDLFPESAGGRGKGFGKAGGAAGAASGKPDLFPESAGGRGKGFGKAGGAAGAASGKPDLFPESAGGGAKAFGKAGGAAGAAGRKPDLFPESAGGRGKGFSKAGGAAGAADRKPDLFPESGRAKAGKSAGTAGRKPHLFPDDPSGGRTWRKVDGVVAGDGGPRAEAGARRDRRFGRAQRIGLWLALRRASGWLAVGGFVLMVAGMPSPSRLLVWFGVGLVVLVAGVGGVAVFRLPADLRLTPRYLWAHDRLMSVGAAVLLLGLGVLVIWTAGLALGGSGMALLTPVVLLGLLAFGVGTLGLWRMRVRR